MAEETTSTQEAPATETTTEGGQEAQTSQVEAKPAQETTAPAEQAPAQDDVSLTPDAENVKKVMMAAELNPEIAKDPNVAKLLEEANKLKNPEAQQNETKETQEEAKPEETSKESTEQTTEESEEQGEETVEGEGVDEGEETTDETEESNLFTSTKTTNLPAFEELGDVVEYMYKQFGLKENDPDALKKHFSSIGKWRNDSQKLVDTQNKLDEAESYFAQLPEPLFNALSDYAAGNDWQESLGGKTLKLDLNKDFSNHKLAEVVNYYFPGEYSEEDLKGDDAVTQKAARFAEKQYNIDKKGFEQQRADYERQAQVRQQNLKTSADSSVKKLKNSFPELNANAERKIRKVLNGGEVLNLFYNGDGSYKEDAAEKLVLAMFGKQELDRLVKKESKKAASRATEAVVSRASDKPSSTKKQEVPVPTSEEDIKKKFSELYPSQTY